MDQDVVAEVFNKGVILGPTINKDRYICPVTGAHFEHRDMCRRMDVMSRQRALVYKENTQQSKKLNKDLNN